MSEPVTKKRKLSELDHGQDRHHHHASSSHSHHHHHHYDKDPDEDDYSEEIGEEDSYDSSEDEASWSELQDFLDDNVDTDDLQEFRLHEECYRKLEQEAPRSSRKSVHPTIMDVIHKYENMIKQKIRDSHKSKIAPKK